MVDLSRFSLEGKVALITGASRGIGRAIALGFAQAGADVAIASRKLPELEAVAEKARDMGRKALPVATHIGDLEEMHNLVDMVISEFGRIDILVNNAGTSPAKISPLDTEEKFWDKIMNLNLKGTYFLSQAVARKMKECGGGKIINVSSINAYVPSYGVGVYSISKAALVMLTKSMALELAEYNIRVNAVAPGTVDTRMINLRWAQLPEKEAKTQKAESVKNIPLKRMAEPEEIVGAAIYLASDASSYTLGETIIIDGGMLLRQVRDAS